MKARGASPVALALLAAACGGPERGAAGRSPSSDRPLRLAPAPDAAPVPAGEVVALWDVPAQRADWEIRAPLVEPRRLDEPPGEEVIFFATNEQRAIDVERRGDYDSTTFNQVHVVAAAAGNVELRAALLRGEELLGQTEPVPLVESAEPRLTVLRLPRPLRGVGPFDRLALRLSGSKKAMGLSSVALVKEPVEGFLPDPRAEPELVQIGGEWRRGVGLSSRVPLRGRARARRGSRLHFSYAPLPELTAPSSTPVLAVVVRAGGEERLRRRVPLERAGWSSAAVDLAPFAGEELQVRFELEQAGTDPVACALAEAALRTGEPGPGSILLVTTDTHRGDHLGTARDGAGVATPVLDAFAAEGVFFERCYTATNYTNPSHVALMTGRHPRDTGVVKNTQRLNSMPWTLAEILRREGWLTWAAVSTRHLLDDVSGLGQGFQRMSGPLGVERTAAETLADVERWLDDRDGRPLFLWLHVFDAHWPYEPPADLDLLYYDPSGEPESWPVKFRVSREHGDIEDLRLPRAQYKAEITGLDRELGRLFERPLFREGLCAVVGDHGESLGAHDTYFAHTGLYPELLHVPLILRWPGAPAGTRVPARVRQIDLGRTLLDLAGLPDADFPGTSLLRHLQPSDDDTVFALHANRISASITEGKRHLILHLVPFQSQLGRHRFAAGDVELFDLARDPACRENLAAREPEVAAALQRRLREWLQDAEELDWIAADEVDSRVRAQLEELGYTEERADGE